MNRIYSCISNVSVHGLTLDQLPLEISSKSLWSCVILNGDGPLASRVCKAFLEADDTRLLTDSDKILQDAEIYSGLYSSIRTYVALNPLETRKSHYQFHEFIVRRIGVLGGTEVAVPQRRLTVKEIRAKNRELQDRALEHTWRGDIRRAILFDYPDLDLDLHWRASEIRSWMKKNLEALLDISELDLGSYELTMLPAEIGWLRALTLLNVEWNKLSELPDEISRLKNLTELNLNCNQFSELPDKIGRLKNLTHLFVAGNKLTKFPLALLQLPNLKEFDISGNQLGASIFQK